MRMMARVVRQAEVVVGTEVQHFLSLYLDSSLLGSFDESFLLVEAGFLDCVQFVLKMFLKFTVHVIVVRVLDALRLQGKVKPFF